MKKETAEMQREGRYGETGDIEAGWMKRQEQQGASWLAYVLNQKET